MASKLPLNKVLGAMDRKDKKFYDNLSDEEKKAFSAFLMNRYASSVRGESALQEWCQGKGIGLPEYKINELSKINGDPKRFLCEIYLNGILESSSFGKSHKKAEKNAATKLIEEFINEGKF